MVGTCAGHFLFKEKIRKLIFAYIFYSMENMKSLCVYCGANFNGDEGLKQAIVDLAKTMVAQEITLVYGGGSVGVMGVIADEVLKLNGTVTGVIPQFLMDKEVGHKGITQMIITENMHQRKQKMADLSDGFVILPGGFGTLEEFLKCLLGCNWAYTPNPSVY